MTTSAEGSLWAVIMAGGSGTRFWPLSRRHRPKQLLPFAGGRSLLRATVDRVLPLVGRERLWVVTAKEMASAVRAELPDLPAESVLVEPQGRDTAACVGWAAWRLAQLEADAAMAMLPADHLVDGEPLRGALRLGEQAARELGGLVTLGVQPRSPETGFGYLQLGDEVELPGGGRVRRVVRFIEKPPRAAAEAMLTHGGYAWNAGMFVWTVAAIRAAIRAHLPELARCLDQLMGEAASRGEEAALARLYPLLPRLSIDVGVMERASEVWAVPVDFAWSDVGSWEGLAEVMGGSQGVHVGDVLGIDSEGAVLVSEGPLVAALGVPGVVVVATRDAVLVIPRAASQRVREIVEELRRRGRDDVL